MKLNPTFVRCIKLVALGAAVSMIFNTSIVLPASSLLHNALIADAHAARVPEMPIMLVPVLLVTSFMALSYIRKHNVAAVSSVK